MNILSRFSLVFHYSVAFLIGYICTCELATLRSLCGSRSHMMVHDDGIVWSDTQSDQIYDLLYRFLRGTNYRSIKRAEFNPFSCRCERNRRYLQVVIFSWKKSVFNFSQPYLDSVCKMHSNEYKKPSIGPVVLEITPGNFRKIFRNLHFLCTKTVAIIVSIKCAALNEYAGLG